MERRRSTMIIYYNIAVWMTLLITDSQTLKSQSMDEKWTAPLSVETLADHQEIQKYGSDSKRIFKKLINPLNDSYINAYNFHDDSTKKSLSKRNTKDINSPQIFKFLSEDAKEPDEATKELIRAHRARELKQRNADSKYSDLSGRPKRSVKFTKPQLIKFEYSDAKEPDAATKELIRQSRAKEISLKKKQVVGATTHVPKTRRQTTRKRKRRSPQKTPPNFIRFQLNDAIDVQNGIRAILQQTVNRDSTENHQSNGSRNLDEPVVQESRQFAYLTAPIKPDRLPNAAQKSIGRNIKERDAQIYYKYMHPHTDARHLVPIYETGSPALSASHSVDNFTPMHSQQAFITETASVHTIPVNVLTSPIHQQSLRPIQLSEVNINQQYYPLAPQTNAAVYHHPTPYLKAISDFPPAFNQVATLPHAQQGYQLVSSLRPIDGNELSNGYPSAKLEEPSHRYGKPLHYTGSGGTGNQQILTNLGTTKFEENQIPFKDVREFRELSSLIGKSPTDQIHGLAYLLAKQMQRSKNMKAKRPHDNTSPILFHPEANREVAKSPNEFENSNVYTSEPLASPNNVLDVPQTEHSPNDKTGEHTGYGPQINSEASVFISKPPAPPQPTSFSVVKMLGVPPNCKENEGMANPRAVSDFESEPEVKKDIVLQNASKYAFGYRVRDFESANDFGHRQNRDLDGVTRGQYHILLPDGRVQNVIYHADDTGFHADVSFKTGVN